jgi:8-oxo-dGTP pyrophosphatase MutT (NUDIX family)
MKEGTIVPIERLELTFAPRPWPFADRQRAEIHAHFTKLRVDKPALWNGRILLLHDYAINGTGFRGEFFETDYACFLAWRDWNIPDVTVKNCFAMGAIKGADGAFVLGIMGDHTANAGSIYFPCGMTDPQSVDGTSVNLEASLWREVAEETGLTSADLDAEPYWHTVFHGPRIGHIRILHARENADALRARILANLALQNQPEFADIYIVRGRADFHSRIEPIVTTFLNSVGI